MEICRAKAYDPDDRCNHYGGAAQPLTDPDPV
jgi:hypothetical protein